MISWCYDLPAVWTVEEGKGIHTNQTNFGGAGKGGPVGRGGRFRTWFRTTNWPVLGLICAGLWIAQPTQALAGSTFLGTIGTGVAVGSVLGASTLPFYGQPGSHLKNIVIGASAGAIVGVGVAIYHKVRGSSDDDQGYSSLSNTPILIQPDALVWSPMVSLSW